MTSENKEIGATYKCGVCGRMVTRVYNVEKRRVDDPDWHISSCTSRAVGRALNASRSRTSSGRRGT